MSLFGLVLTLIFQTASASEIAVFKEYKNNIKKQYSSSEKTLSQSGDSYVKQHALVAEKMSLADMLPTNSKDLPKFCKNYLTDVANYYDLRDVRQVSSIKSPSYLEFSKMVRGQCYKVLKKN